MFLQWWLTQLRLCQESMVLSGSVTGETLSLPSPTPVTVDGTVNLTPGMGRESNCWSSPWAEILNKMTEASIKWQSVKVRLEDSYSIWKSWIPYQKQRLELSSHNFTCRSAVYTGQSTVASREVILTWIPSLMLNLYFHLSAGISILEDAVMKPSNSRVKGTALCPTSPISDVIIVDSFVSEFNTELPLMHHNHSGCL